MGIRRLPAAALLVLLLAVAVAGEAAQEEAVVAGRAELKAGGWLKEIEAKARAQRERAAVLRAALSDQEALVVNITQKYNEALKMVIGDMSETIATLQNEHANLAVNSLLQKISEQSLQAKERAKSHMETAMEEPLFLQALEALVVNITEEYNETLKKVIGDMSQTIATLQNEHAYLAVNSLLQKISEQSLQAKERAKPHMETAMEEPLFLQALEQFVEWIHDIEEPWPTAKTITEPYVQMVSAKSAEVYQASRDAISPHVLKAHEFADPYFQEAKKLSKPYIDQVAKASKPHVEKLKTTLKPYTAKAGDAYEKFLETANYVISRKSRKAESK